MLFFFSRWRRGETVKEDEQVNLQEPIEPSTPVTSVIEIKKGRETVFHAFKHHQIKNLILLSFYSRPSYACYAWCWYYVRFAFQ